jgi:hypothetical protein
LSTHCTSTTDMPLYTYWQHSFSLPLTTILSQYAAVLVQY